MMFKVKKDANKRLKDEFGFLIGFQVFMYSIVILNALAIRIGFHAAVARASIDIAVHFPFIGLLLAKMIESIVEFWPVALIVAIILIVILSIDIIVDCVFDIRIHA